jgi:hypothetical protein
MYKAAVPAALTSVRYPFSQQNTQLSSAAVKMVQLQVHRSLRSLGAAAAATRNDGGHTTEIQVPC